MSSSNGGNGDDSNQGGAGRREVAWRVFAAEYDDADFDYSESDEERAPNYVITPTGARINRLFVVGVLTEVEPVSDDVLRGRVVDPTGAFVLYAGQYQPDEMAFLESADPPAFVAVTGKARTFQPDDSDRVFTSIRPESINRVDAETRDRWVVQTAEQTLWRVSTVADAIDSGERGDALRQALEANGVDSGLASGIPLALDHYGTTEEYLADVRDLAVDSAKVVAGELDADDVGPLELAPGEGSDEVGVDLDFTPTAAETGADDLSELESEGGESEDEVVAETDSEPETTEEIPETVESTTKEPEDIEEIAEETEETSDADIGEAPTSTVDDSETGELGDAPEAEAEAPETEAPAVEDAEDAAERQDEVGTEEPPTVESEQEASTDESFEPETDGQSDGPDIGTAGAGDEMYEFDEEEREQVEEEYGLEFSSGSEVESPEESDLDAPDPEAGLEPEEDAEPAADADELTTETAEEPAEETTDELEDFESVSGDTEEEEATADEEATAEQGEPENLEDTVMQTMRDLNEGDGVDRETLLAAVVDDYDVTPADVDDALEAALMAGRCYESGEETLKPI